ncbi:hypothetical protein SADUNF_Sadunf18G0095200 [Salix dunnii]|uniref:Major facilitator superfamily (MFS) profile domain-containing protein n=1 Tax=Salix dunnii TaxID=1413687 RepID=A0A835J493_9ROSI|nr:hypothetical protein SADUNF_Sadunf18G0095200 [Salix dunnii]
MANLTLNSKSFCSLSHNTYTQTSVFKTTTSFKNNSLHFLHSGNNLKFRVWCGIKEKENVKESESVPDELAGLKRADKLEPKRGSSLDFEQGLGNDSGSSEVDFYRKWPPWKNIPHRYKLIGSTSLAFVICNMDKVNLSIAIIPMSHQFGWNASTAGLVQSSFFWGYALSQLPGGWLAKIFGGRKVLQIGVLTWSVATALLPLLAGYMPGFVLSRVLVGIGEGVSPSAATDLIARHDYFCGLWSVLLTLNNFMSIPLEERSRAVAFVFGGLSVGSVTGLLLAPPLIQEFGWASVFFIFGFLGIAWFLGFQYLEEGQASFSAKPTSRKAQFLGSQSIYSEKSSSNALAELGSSLKNHSSPGSAIRSDILDCSLMSSNMYSISVKPPEGKYQSSLMHTIVRKFRKFIVFKIIDVPWKAFFQTPAVWAMIYAHFCGSWGHYTCLSWLPSYFSEELSLNLTEAAWVSLKIYDSMVCIFLPVEGLILLEVPEVLNFTCNTIEALVITLEIGIPCHNYQQFQVSILPPLASVFVTSIAAQLADKLIANGVEITTVRKICQTIAFLSPALCMTLSSVDLGLPPWEIVGILTSGLALSSFALSGLYCTHQDMSPEYASILLGITNTVGAIPGIVGIPLTGYLLDTTHSWSVNFIVRSINFLLLDRYHCMVGICQQQASKLFQNRLTLDRYSWMKHPN